jgi:hypothetical protein
MKHNEQPINSAAIRLYINHEGQIDTEMAWNCSEKLDDEYVDALVESIHGLLAILSTQFDQVRMAGKTFLAGKEAVNDANEGEITFTPDDGSEEEAPVSKKVVSINPSNRKH